MPLHVFVFVVCVLRVDVFFVDSVCAVVGDCGLGCVFCVLQVFVVVGDRV